MNAKQIEVHDYYKALHPEALILYHIPGKYMALGEDVDRVLESLSTTCVLESGVGVVPDSLSILSELGSDGTEVCVIDYLNDDGLLDFPDIERIKAEKEMDY